MESIKDISTSIREEALRLGFADCGFSKAELLNEDADQLKAWLSQGYHGRMGYMANHFEKRIDPSLLMEGATSVISLLFNYFTEKVQTDPEAPVISKYAYGKDYHFVMKDRMNLLFEFIKSIHPEVEGRVFVDSAPVLDRAWARKAGLGWIGKNSNLISRKAGSFVFIGEIILNVDLDYNKLPESDFCGSCTKCIDACPTTAILSTRTLNAERCISYQTIEHKGEIPDALSGSFENRIFGCDICQDVCPWNRASAPHQEKEFEPSEELMELTLESWTSMTRSEYQKLFRHSPVKRAGFEKLKGNLDFLQKKSTS